MIYAVRTLPSTPPKRYAALLAQAILAGHPGRVWEQADFIGILQSSGVAYPVTAAVAGRNKLLELGILAARPLGDNLEGYLGPHRGDRWMRRVREARQLVADVLGGGAIQVSDIQDRLWSVARDLDTLRGQGGGQRCAQAATAVGLALDLLQAEAS